jgi:tetratricopeptide (TPR) repeat protein
MALAEQGKLREAEAAYRKAIHFRPGFAEAHCNLGGVLQREGRLADAVAAYRRGDELGRKVPGWPYPSERWLREAERLVVLDRKLPAILRGDAEPASAAEGAELARLCGQYRGRPAAAARLAAAAFAADPKLAGDLNALHRYNAACSAILAATGQGEDARLLPDKVVVVLRRQAFGWLGADLAAYEDILDRGNPPVRPVIRKRLLRWQQDPDLASMRDRIALERLDPDERQRWQKLWQTVADLAKRAGKPAG